MATKQTIKQGPAPAPAPARLPTDRRKKLIRLLLQVLNARANSAQSGPPAISAGRARRYDHHELDTNHTR